MLNSSCLMPQLSMALSSMDQSTTRVRLLWDRHHTIKLLALHRSSIPSSSASLKCIAGIKVAARVPNAAVIRVEPWQIGITRPNGQPGAATWTRATIEMPIMIRTSNLTVTHNSSRAQIPCSLAASSECQSVRFKVSIKEWIKWGTYSLMEVKNN